MSGRFCDTRPPLHAAKSQLSESIITSVCGFRETGWRRVAPVTTSQLSARPRASEHPAIARDGEWH